jgi:hypothetical protein
VNLSFFGRIKTFLKALFDIRDLFVFGGLFLVGYGLYLFEPWVSYVIVGLILMSIGLFFGRAKK